VPFEWSGTWVGFAPLSGLGNWANTDPQSGAILPDLGRGPKQPPQASTAYLRAFQGVFLTGCYWFLKDFLLKPSFFTVFIITKKKNKSFVAPNLGSEYNL
jgi:hypothetical protein